MKTRQERFDEKWMPEPFSGCWLWTAAINNTGYGYFGWGGDSSEGAAHRASWRLYKGEIPHGISVLHHCDVPACVNPEHLFLGTGADNSRDMVRKGRSTAGVSNPNSTLTEADVLAIRSDTRTLKPIAEDYGISTSQVHRIKLNQHWKCVEFPSLLQSAEDQRRQERNESK